MYPPDQTYVCQCGQRFDGEMTLAVHCNLVNHKFREHVVRGTKSTSLQPQQRKKFLAQTLPVRAFLTGIRDTRG